MAFKSIAAPPPARTAPPPGSDHGPKGPQGPNGHHGSNNSPFPVKPWGYHTPTGGGSGISNCRNVPYFPPNFTSIPFRPSGFGSFGSGSFGNNGGLINCRGGYHTPSPNSWVQTCLNAAKIGIPVATVGLGALALASHFNPFTPVKCY